MNSKLKVVCIGIQIKLNRGENLEDILVTYVNLTEDEKNIIRNHFDESK